MKDANNINKHDNCENASNDDNVEQYFEILQHIEASGTKPRKTEIIPFSRCLFQAGFLSHAPVSCRNEQVIPRLSANHARRVWKEERYPYN